MRNVLWENVNGQSIWGGGGEKRGGGGCEVNICNALLGSEVNICNTLLCFRLAL